MKSYKEITYRYLKGQKNRTLLTILGIILSVAMISAIGTIVISARGALLDEAIREAGSFHARFRNVEKQNIEKIINHVGVKEYGISQKEGWGIVAETTEEERNAEAGLYRYIEIEGFKQEALDMLPYRMEEGRFPENSSEIAIEPYIVPYFKDSIKIGDKINLPIGDISFVIREESGEKKSEEVFEKKREREYTVVGFIHSKYRASVRYETKGITALDKDSPEIGKYNVYFKLPNVKNAQEKIYSIARDVGVDEEDVRDNYRVLRLSAESLDETFNRSLMLLLAFVIILIMVSTIAVIYNAFNISVLERVSQFGLLRSVGATPNQIKGIVIKEATILSAIGIPIGLFSGVLAMKIVFYIIGLISYDIILISDMKINISLAVFIFSSIIGLITVFLSAIGPATRAAKISPLEAVRNTGSFKKESFDKIKKSNFIRKVLGIEGEIAYKNLRRNRKKFYITVFSMVISISLFITFSTFSDFMFKMGVVESQEIGDFLIYGSEDLDEKIFTELKDIKDVNRVYNYKMMNGKSLLSKDKISKKNMELQAYLLDNMKDDFTEINSIQVYTIGDENFEVLKGQLNSGIINVEELDKSNGVLVINNTYAYNDKTRKLSLIEGYHIKTGDKILFAFYDSDKEGEETKYNELNVMGVLDKGLLGNEYNANGGFSIIVTEKQWATLNNGHREDTKIFVEMIKDGNMENIRTYLDEVSSNYPGFNYMDYAEKAKENRTMGIVMNIFLYGFVTIITLISSINIINTISTNIILRTKEISMIKAVGMAQSGIKRMVALESLYYGLYAAVFGAIIGTGLTYILFKIVFNISEFQWVVPWKNIIIASVGATIIALFSGVYPLKRINNSIIVENMKNEE